MHEYMYDYKVENALRDSYSNSFLHLILKADNCEGNFIFLKHHKTLETLLHFVLKAKLQQFCIFTVTKNKTQF